MIWFIVGAIIGAIRAVLYTRSHYVPHPLQGTLAYAASHAIGIGLLGLAVSALWR